MGEEFFSAATAIAAIWIAASRAQLRRDDDQIEKGIGGFVKLERLSASTDKAIARDVRVAHASRVLAMAYSPSRTFPKKTVSARRRNQHARRVRYPESIIATRDNSD